MVLERPVASKSEAKKGRQVGERRARIWSQQPTCPGAGMEWVFVPFLLKHF